MSRHLIHNLAIGWFVFSGGGSGILLAAIVLELITPGGHPFYRMLHEWLASFC